MRLTTAILCSALLVAGCSKSSEQLLKDGDPKVCAKSDVTNQLFAIIKQNASSPPSDGAIQDYDSLAKQWMEAISLSVYDVTSKEVDAPNRKITCNADVHIRADGVNQQQNQNVDYKVSTDLSDGNIIVEVDTSNIRYMLNQLLVAISEKDFKKAQDQKAYDDEAKIESYKKIWNHAHQSDMAESKSMLEGKYQYFGFSADDRNSIIETRALAQECLGSTGEEKRLICKLSDSSPEKLLGKNLCHTNGTWQHCDGSGIGGTQPNTASFTPAETALTNQADDLNDKCRDTHPEVCDQRDAFYDKLKAQGICWGPADAASEADKHWVRCGA